MIQLYNEGVYAIATQNSPKYTKVIGYCMYHLFVPIQSCATLVLNAVEQLSILSLTQQTVVIAVVFPTVILGAVSAFLGEYMPHNIIMCTTIEVVIYIFVFKTSTQIYSNNLI